MANGCTAQALMAARFWSQKRIAAGRPGVWRLYTKMRMGYKLKPPEWAEI